MPKIPIDTSVEAEYEDGYIHSETELDDISQWVEGKNVFHDILNKLPEEAHGKMVRFSCFWKDQAYHLDWTALPDNARPIRFRHGYYTRNLDGSFVESGFSGVDFGVQFNDESGKNHQDVIELR